MFSDEFFVWFLNIIFIMIALLNRDHPFTPAERMHHELEGERMGLEEAVAYIFDDSDALELDVAMRGDPQASLT